MADIMRPPSYCTRDCEPIVFRMKLYHLKWYNSLCLLLPHSSTDLTVNLNLEHLQITTYSTFDNKGERSLGRVHWWFTSSLKMDQKNSLTLTRRYISLAGITSLTGPGKDINSFDWVFKIDLALEYLGTSHVLNPSLPEN